MVLGSVYHHHGEHGLGASQAAASSSSSAPPAAGAGAGADVPLAVQIADLELRARACEAKLGVDSEGAAAMLRQLEKAGGGGKAKNLDQMAADAAKSSSRLMMKEDAISGAQLVRVVDTVLLRLWSMKDGDRVLVEVSEEEREEGRRAKVLHLPGTDRERGETPKEAVSRTRASVLQTGDLKMQFNFEKTDTYTKEEEDPAFPGLMTLYRIEIIEGFVASADVEMRSRFSMDENEGSFARTDKSGRLRNFRWISEEQALDKQVKIRSDPLSSYRMPVLTPIEAVRSQLTGSMCQRVTEVSKKVDTIFSRDKRLPELERDVGLVDVWMHSDPSRAPSQLLQERAKRKYVAQHAPQLHEFTKALGEISRLEYSINPPTLQDLPSNNERLKRLEARSAVAVAAAAQLHGHVAKIAEEYYGAMLSLSEQMAGWNKLLEGSA